jgi:hypothetical protein
MVATMPWEERDCPTADLGHRDGIGRRTVGCVDDVFGRSVQKGVKPRPANNPDVGTYGHAETLLREPHGAVRDSLLVCTSSDAKPDVTGARPSLLVYTRTYRRRA